MVREKKYKNIVRVEHVCDIDLYTQLANNLNEMPNGTTRTDYINTAIQAFNKLDKEDRMKMIKNYLNNL